MACRTRPPADRAVGGYLWLTVGMDLLTDEHIAEAGSLLGHHVFYAKHKPGSLE